MPPCPRSAAISYGPSRMPGGSAMLVCDRILLGRHGGPRPRRARRPSAPSRAPVAHARAQGAHRFARAQGTRRFARAQGRRPFGRRFFFVPNLVTYLRPRSGRPAGALAARLAIGSPAGAPAALLTRGQGARCEPYSCSCRRNACVRRRTSASHAICIADPSRNSSTRNGGSPEQSILMRPQSGRRPS
jgi:hypothetical protein